MSFTPSTFRFKKENSSNSNDFRSLQNETQRTVCAFMTAAHLDRSYNIPDLMRMHFARKMHELGESPSDKVGARSSFAAENQSQDWPLPRPLRGRRRKLAEVMERDGSRAEERREKIGKKLGISEYRQASPQVHFAVLAV